MVVTRLPNLGSDKVPCLININVNTTTTDDDIERRLDALDPAVTPAQDARDLRDIHAIVQASSNLEDAQRQLLEAVTAARRNGKSWAKIGIALGVSRQAARERFKGLVG